MVKNLHSDRLKTREARALQSLQCGVRGHFLAEGMVSQLIYMYIKSTSNLM